MEGLGYIEAKRNLLTRILEECLKDAHETYHKEFESHGSASFYGIIGPMLLLFWRRTENLENDLVKATEVKEAAKSPMSRSPLKQE